MAEASLKVSGAVTRDCELTEESLAGIDGRHQIADVSQLDPKRKGRAVTLEGLLALVGVKPEARWLGLHSSKDDFHASIPLAAVRERAVLIYQLDGRALPESAGGPVRFFIPDFAACHTAEVDECASVKFVDHIELTAERGYDNRPHDDQEHEKLHKNAANDKR